MHTARAGPGPVQCMWLELAQGQSGAPPACSAHAGLDPHTKSSPDWTHRLAKLAGLSAHGWSGIGATCSAHSRLALYAVCNVSPRIALCVACFTGPVQVGCGA